jgi:UDPglucose 6-dehydrogenase
VNREKVVVIGAGRAGLATALTLAHLGHDVTCTDIDERRIAELTSGRAPFVEPELQGRLDLESSTGRLRFIVSGGKGTSGAGVVIICVATPSRDDGSCDLSYLNQSVDALEQSLEPGSVVVTKSTVPVGTNARLAARLAPRGVHVVSNPEFLREGAIMRDSMQPSRIVLGGTGEEALNRVANLFEGLGAPLVRMSYEAAELTKYAANCYLAVRYSFVNELATLAVSVGADVDDVLRAMAFDNRIGAVALRPGPGWGGPCLPKDSRALLRQAEAAGEQLRVLQAAVGVNHDRVERIVGQVRELCGGSLDGVLVAVWGLAFKAETDDNRESPAMSVVEALVLAGARCSAFDPAVPAEAYPPKLRPASSPLDACAGAAVLVVLTAWSEFLHVDLGEVASALTTARALDTTGIIDRGAAVSAGLECVQIGQQASR